jgi:hypothetical protein
MVLPVEPGASVIRSAAEERCIECAVANDPWLRFTVPRPKLEDMSKRAITAKQRAWLLDELSLWRRDALVSDQQSQRIADLYEGAGEMAERARAGDPGPASLGRAGGHVQWPGGIEGPAD